MLLDTLTKDVQSALKKGDTVRVETLRFLIAAVHNALIAKYGAVWEKSATEEDVTAVVGKQIKSHKESVEAFIKAGRTDLVDKEQAQLVILESLMPPQIADDQLRIRLAKIVSSGETNFGLLMKQAMQELKSEADGGRVSEILKQMLNQVNRTTNQTGSINTIKK